MTDNEKLCKFQGWQTTKDGKHLISIAKDYLNDDAAAMSLLDTLVEKGYEYIIDGSKVHIEVDVFYDNEQILARFRNTRRGAIVAACLELIRKEDV